MCQVGNIDFRTKTLISSMKTLQECPEVVLKRCREGFKKYMQIQLHKSKRFRRSLGAV